MIRSLAILSFLICSSAIAQTGINYQAVARDAAGEILTSTSMTVRFSIQEGTSIGPTAYEEIHSTMTNEHGLLNLVIGDGTPTVGSYSGIAWKEQDHFLVVDLNLGGGYSQMGASQLLSVPYAHVAQEVINDKDEQSLTHAGDSVLIDNGNGIDLSKYKRTVRRGFSTSGTWVCPAGVYEVEVQLWGGAGGGAGGQGAYCPSGIGCSDGPTQTFGAAGGSGGAGGYNEGIIPVVPGTSYGVVVGEGGSGGQFGDILSITETDGGNGGDSSFDGILLAFGGEGGKIGNDCFPGLDGDDGAQVNFNPETLEQYTWNIGQSYLPVEYAQEALSSTLTTCCSTRGIGGAGGLSLCLFADYNAGEMGTDGEAGYCVITY